MAYSKTTWVDGTTDITATRLNNIETGVDDAHTDIATLEGRSVNAGNGLEGGGTLAADRTLAITAGGVDTAELATGAVTATRLATDAVSTPKIVDGAVTNAKIASGAVEPSQTTFLAALSDSAKLHVGQVAADGTAVELPAGWSVTHTASSGVYEVSHTLSTASFIVIAMPFGGSVTSAHAYGTAKSSTAFTIVTYDSKGGAVEDNPFDFLLVRY